jgi:hypothetical protein
MFSLPLSLGFAKVMFLERKRYQESYKDVCLFAEKREDPFLPLTFH